MPRTSRKKVSISDCECYETIYIVKHALTKGIVKMEGRVLDSGMVIYAEQHARKFHTAGPTVYALTLNDAIKSAEAMRLKKIASLEKQIRALKELSFTK